MKVQSVIDVHSWDEAQWKGILYASYGDDVPPMFVLTFTNAAPLQPAIAHALGYSSSQYFATTFKRVTGVTPRTYRTTTGHDAFGL